VRVGTFIQNSEDFQKTKLLDSNAICTTVLSPIFELNRSYSGDESNLVAEVGHGWHHLLRNMKDIMDFVGENRELVANV